MIDELEGLICQYKYCLNENYIPDIENAINRLIAKREKEMRRKGFEAARESQTVGWGGVAKGRGPIYKTFEEFELTIN